MNCPEFEERIALLVDGGLERGAAWEVERHLRSCSNCAEFASEMEFDRELLRMPPPECSEVDFIALRRAIRRRISEERPRAKWMPALAMAASILLMVAVAWFGRRSEQTPATPVQTARVTHETPPAVAPHGAAEPVITAVARRKATPKRIANRPTAEPVPRPDPNLEAALREFLAKEETPPAAGVAVSPVAIRFQTNNPDVVLILLPETSGGFE